MAESSNTYLPPSAQSNSSLNIKNQSFDIGASCNKKAGDQLHVHCTDGELPAYSNEGEPHFIR